MAMDLDWKTWALVHLANLRERANETGANYIDAACPRCDRYRLEPDRERRLITCEKCNLGIELPELDDQGRLLGHPTDPPRS